jgi:hypothetical protein
MSQWSSTLHEPVVPLWTKSDDEKVVLQWLECHLLEYTPDLQEVAMDDRVIRWFQRVLSCQHPPSLRPFLRDSLIFLSFMQNSSWRLSLPKRRWKVNNGTWTVPRKTPSWTSHQWLKLHVWGATLDNDEQWRKAARNSKSFLQNVVLPAEIGMTSRTLPSL